jgi:hypothetical protein
MTDKVTELLATLGLTQEEANVWMFTPNRLLGRDTPAERIEAGAYKDVLHLIEAVADGVVV